MRRMVVVMAVVVVSGAFGLQQLNGGSAAAQEEAGPSVDDRARRLVERLGSLCRNYDFFYKHEFGSGVMRPVRCSRVNREKTVLVVYAFSDRRTKTGWLNEWGSLAHQRGADVVRGKRWTVEVLVRKWTDEVRERLRG